MTPRPLPLDARDGGGEQRQTVRVGRPAGRSISSGCTARRTKVKPTRRNCGERRVVDIVAEPGVVLAGRDSGTSW